MFKFDLISEQGWNLFFADESIKQNKWGICWRLIKKTYLSSCCCHRGHRVNSAAAAAAVAAAFCFLQFPNNNKHDKQLWDGMNDGMMELKHESGRWLLTPVEAKIRSFRSSQSRWSLITRSTEMFPKMFQKTAKMLPSFNTNKIGNSNAVQFESNLKQFT